ncbi:FMN-dependent NADH-azoreductase [Actinoplanes couchii]|uniref:FMN dependent NADH:quinone oxidoreductase n=1 Tax=Actinoplanes couchii TaxID=403638 RepID=A0ABQ3XN04_9ACTN|nr:NAD(P)H-dependent oxidoreductase [Actinoplanes couchii]MDR6317867.1 FMN-dependent NADH-azoreductase [Actinoplanes couchii]GID59855.1 FMN-dependent NADH-azoreductase [Actinoplanes couchii]
MNLLHISASPRGPRSESLAVASSFLQAARETNPDLPISTWDLWDGTLPSFGPDAVTGKMTVFAGLTPSGPAATAYDAATAAFHRFDAADTYLFSVPMWNSAIPYILKQLIDVISQPGLAFAFDPASGYRGLLRGKRAAIIYTSAVYGPGLPPTFGADFQAPYLEDWLRWTGVTEIHPIRFGPNLTGPDPDPARRTAHAKARNLAKILVSRH